MASAAQSSEPERSSLVARFLGSPVAVLLLLGLVWRLAVAYVLLPNVGLQGDLNLFRDWALTLANKGPGAYYASSSFADYTPGYLWLLWPLGVIAKAIGIVTSVNPVLVAGSLVKLPAIAGDAAAALLIYRALDGWRGRRSALVGAFLFLANPVTWYESAVWGQVDVIGGLVLFASLLLLVRRREEPATALAVLAALIKPQLGIGLVVVAAVLIRRHVISRKNDTERGPWGARGPLRLLTSGVTGLVVALGLILPFDLPTLAPANLAAIPIVGHIAGLISLVVNAADYYNVLTANAFNGWALAGPNPLSQSLSSGVIWTFDSLPVLGPISAAAFGSAAFAIVVIAVVIYLLRADGPWPILIGASVLAVAFFALPTRVHERYLFPVFVLAAPLAAVWLRWRIWYLLLAGVNLANLHAILTLPFPGYGSSAAIGLPFGAALRTPVAVSAVALTITVAFAWLIWQLNPVFAGLPAVAEPESGRADGAPPSRAAPALARGWGALPRLRPRIVAAGRAYLGPLAARLAVPSRQPDRSAELDAEPSGRLDRRDAVLVVGLFAVVLLTRTIGLERPMTMYFDEIYHPRSGMEFLQGSRYGIPHTIYENTHPHVAKYLEAVGIDTWGDNRVVATGNTGLAVTAAAVDPARTVPTSGGAAQGRLVVATGDGVTTTSLHDATPATHLALPGAQAVAVDGIEVAVGTADGAIYLLNDGELGGRLPLPNAVAHFGGAILGLWLIPGRIVAETAGGQILSIDARTGAISGSAEVARLGGAAIHAVNGRAVISIADATGLRVLDLTTLVPLFSARFASGATDVVFIDGSDSLYRGRDMFGQPALYVANGTATLSTFTIPPTGNIAPTGQVQLPGSITQLVWNRATNLVHMLGRTATGAPTIYVLEPNSNATFADAPLGFEPIAWGLDVIPDTPETDREQLVAIAADGRTATIDVGSNAFAWRFIGVLAGAVMAVALYLLVRLLFRRRSIALLASGAVLVDGLLYAQSRIGMNDTFVGMFIVLAFLALVALLRVRGSGRLGAVFVAVGLPLVGVLLGLALASKWVGAYAMGGALAVVLMGSALGRLAIVAGLVGLTGLFGFLALADSPSDITFAVLLLVLTACAAVAAARSGVQLSRRDVDYLSGAPIALAVLLAAGLAVVALLVGLDRLAAGLPAGPSVVGVRIGWPFVMVAGLTILGLGVRGAFEVAGSCGVGPFAAGRVAGSAASGASGAPGAAGAPDAVEHPSDWREPGFGFGLPFTWALVCLAIVPLVVYVVTYIPWATTTAGGPQLFPGWPPGHTGQTLLDLTASMYRYHNELRAPHASSSPWWAWPFDFKPIWGYNESFSDGRQATVFMTGNVVLFWLGIPAAAFGLWQAWRRRSTGLAVIAIAFLALWLPWSRIDRVAYQYHWYTSLPFFFVLLAYFLAELWHGPSIRTWRFARLSAAVVIMAPGLLWLGKGAVCAVAGVPDTGDPEVCGPSSPVVSVASTGYLIVAALIAWLVILPAQHPRRLVVGVGVSAAAFFIAFIPVLSGWALPAGWSVAYQQLLPTWALDFQFGSNTNAAPRIALLSLGPAVLAAIALAVAAWAFGWAARRPWPFPGMIRPAFTTAVESPSTPPRPATVLPASPPTAEVADSSR